MMVRRFEIDPCPEGPAPPPHPPPRGNFLLSPPLVPHILRDPAELLDPHRPQVVSLRPLQRIVPRVTIPIRQARSRPLQALNHPRHVEGRRQLEQDVHVIAYDAKLDRSRTVPRRFLYKEPRQELADALSDQRHASERGPAEMDIDADRHGDSLAPIPRILGTEKTPTTALRTRVVAEPALQRTDKPRPALSSSLGQLRPLRYLSHESSHGPSRLRLDRLIRARAGAAAASGALPRDAYLPFAPPVLRRAREVEAGGAEEWAGW